jgi:YVTN family beta-propeller protein
VKVPPNFLSRYRHAITVGALVISFVPCDSFCSTNSIESAATPLPSPQVTLNYVTSRLAADPVRPRVYATVAGANSVIVIDTNTLSVIKTIPIGSIPRGLAISADNSKLWVANSGSTNFAVGVINLDRLTTLPSLPAPAQPYDIVEGSGHRLYLTPAGNSYPYYGVMQIDSDTGQYQGSLGSSDVYVGFVDVTPDRKTLFYGTSGVSPSTLDKFDISTANGLLLQRTNNVGSNGESLTVSHFGAWLVYPNGGGNSNYGYVTYEIPTANIASVNCSFDLGPYPTSAAFSNDDSLLYHGAATTSRISTFETTFGTLLGSFDLPNSDSVNDVVVDRSGQWLFVSTSRYGSPAAGDIRIFNTGRTDPLQPFATSIVSRKTHGGAGTFDVDLTSGNGIECRGGGANGDYTLVFTFANTLTSVANVSVRSGTGSVAGSAIDGNDAHNYIVNLTGVANAQSITVSLNNVADSAGYFSSSIPASMGVLIGDTTGNSAVNSSDIAQTQSQTGQPVTSDNFREDVTANGLINSSDIALVQSMSGTGIGSAQPSSGAGTGSSAPSKKKRQSYGRVSQWQ